MMVVNVVKIGCRAPRVLRWRLSRWRRLSRLLGLLPRHL